MKPFGLFLPILGFYVTIFGKTSGNPDFSTPWQGSLQEGRSVK
jgi:hypothetical protein